jgi:hypothetical protein
MKLVRIAKGHWDVLAVADPPEGGSLLDDLPRSARRFLNICLGVYMPLEGPAAHLCRPVGDGLFELRPPGSVAGPGVLFFQGEGQRIVCTRAHRDLRSAHRSRERYFEACAAGGLQVFDDG